jgi:hypothetical protein
VLCYCANVSFDLANSGKRNLSKECLRGESHFITMKEFTPSSQVEKLSRLQIALWKPQIRFNTTVFCQAEILHGSLNRPD